MPSPELQAAADLMRAVALFGAEVPVADQRLAWEQAAELSPVPDGVTVTATEVAGVSAEWVDPPGVVGWHDGGRILLYLHGGGYVIGSARTHRAVVARLAQAAGASALVLDYRRGPEHPYPAALDDARSAWAWLLDQGVEPARVAFAGDSAGGGLALAAALAERQARRMLPAALVCCSPWVDLALTGASLDDRADEDPVLSRAWLQTMADHYLAGADPTEPTASPLYGDLRGLPPLLVAVGTAEVLHDDASRLVDAAASADVEVEFETYPGAIHLWMQIAPDSPEARAGVQHIAGFLRSRLAVPGH